MTHCESNNNSSSIASRLKLRVGSSGTVEHLGQQHTTSNNASLFHRRLRPWNVLTVHQLGTVVSERRGLDALRPLSIPR